MSDIIINKLNQIASSISHDSSFDDISPKKVDTAIQISKHQILKADSPLISRRINEEEFYIAKVWAAQLKRLKSEQRLFAEKAIYDLLFEARLGNLNKNSVKINERDIKDQQSLINSDSTPSASSQSLQNSSMSAGHSQKMRLSSEVILTESYLLENELNPPTCGADHSKSYTLISKGNALRIGQHNRNKTIIVAATSSESRMDSENIQLTEKSCHGILIQDNLQSDIFSSTNVATNTSCIIAQLSRCMRDVYNNCKSYINE